MKPLGLLAVALAVGAPALNAEFTITLNWGAGMTEQNKVYFTDAAKYWMEQISGYKNGVTLTGITINAEIAPDDGVYGTLGFARPTEFATQGGTVYATAGEMSFDSADLDWQVADGSFKYVIRHEMGHVLGIGSLWTANGLYTNDTGRYTGENAIAAWRDEFGQTSADFMPIELGGGGGTRNGHWDEVEGGAGPTGFVSKYTGKDFQYELMTGWANGTDMFTSNVTLGGLRDLGYEIGIPLDAEGNYILEKGSYFGIMSGARRARKITTGTATVLGNNTFTGGLYIEQGTLLAQSEHALGRGAVIVQNGSILNVDKTNVNGVDVLTLQNGKIIGTTGSLSANLFNLESGVVSATLAGNGVVEKTTEGTVVLAGQNTYAGGTVVTAGTLVVANPNALARGPITVNGGKLDIAEINVVVENTLTVNGGTVAGGTGTLNAKAYQLTGGTVATTLTGAGALTKTGTGTAIIASSNLYTGGSRITEGTLRVDNRTGLSTGAVIVDGGTLDLNSQITGVRSLTLESGTIAGTGSIEATTVELRKGTVTGSITGAGRVTKTTEDTVTLAGKSTFTGGLTVEAGLIRATGANSLGGGNVMISGTGQIMIEHSEAAALSTVDLVAGGITFSPALRQASIGTLLGSTNLALQNSSGESFALTLGTNNATGDYAGSFSGKGSLTKGGTGTLTLNAASTHEGGSGVAAGTLRVANVNALGSGSISVSGGSLDIGSYDIATGAGKALSLTGGSLRGSTTGSITASAYNVQAGTVAVNLAGSGRLTKSGTGTVLISAATEYSGGTEINEGTLKVTNAQGLGTGEIVINKGGTLTTESAIAGVGILRLQSGNITGNVGSVNAAGYDLQSGKVEVKLVGSASATVNKNTEGIVTLTRANSITGSVNVNAGTLVIQHAYGLGKGKATIYTGGTLQVGDDNEFNADWTGQEVKLAGGTLNVKLTSDTTISRVISGTGRLELNGTGTITLQNAAFDGNTIVNKGTLVLEPNAIPRGAVTVNAGGQVEIKTTGATYNVSKDISGEGTIRFSGAGNVVMHNALSHTGTITVAKDTTLSLGAQTGDYVKLNTTRLTIEQGATLLGAGSINGSLKNAGTIAPGFSPGTLTINGDFENTGTLRMEIATGANDKIEYTGQAFLSGNLEVAYIGSPQKGQTVTLLTDTSTTDGKASIVGRFNRITSPATGGIAYATATELKYIVGGTVFDLPGASMPQSGRLQSFSQALNTAAATNATINGVTSTFTNNGATLANTIRGAAPLGLASATAMPLAQSNEDGDLLYRHLTARRFERATGIPADFSPYVYANNTQATADDTKDGRAFDHTSTGGSVGADMETRELLVGAKISYDAGRAKYHRGAGKLDQDHLRMTLYGSTMISGIYFVDTGVFGGYSLYDSKRNTALGRETGDTTGWDAGAFVTVGMAVPLSEETSLTPHVGITAAHAQVDGFNESGSALALRIKGYGQDSLAARIGTGINHVTTIGDMKVRYALDASFVHEFLDEEVDIDGTVSGAAFSTSAVAGLKDRIEVGPEINFGISETQSISVSYKFEYGFGDGESHRIDAGYRTRF